MDLVDKYLPELPEFSMERYRNVKKKKLTPQQKKERAKKLRKEREFTQYRN